MVGPKDKQVREWGPKASYWGYHDGSEDAMAGESQKWDTLGGEVQTLDFPGWEKRLDDPPSDAYATAYADGYADFE